jgi:protein-tyrosine-phosphatase
MPASAYDLDALFARLGLSLEEQLLVRHGQSRLAAEFRGLFGPETVERFVHDSLDALSGARIKQFIPLFTERFARDRLWSLAKVEGRITVTQPVVLFLCVHNAGRSQMAAGWLAHFAGDAVRVMTGGSDPGSEVNPNAILAMDEVGINIREHFPKPWTDEVVRAADVVVTMGCGDACPIFPGKRYEDWETADPAGLDLAGVRAVRDDLRRRVEALLASLRLPAAA